MLVRYEYDVFGAVRSEVGTSDSPRKFTGKEYDSDVKLYYYAARYYDPYIGRFTQRDPAGDGINWYAYAYNNPLGFIDVSGLAAVKLTNSQKDAAEKIFQGVINLDKVRLVDSGLKFNIVNAASGDAGAVTYGYHIYDMDGVMVNQTDSNRPSMYLLIHELTHVWQYDNHRIEGFTAAATQGIALLTGQRDNLYEYSISSYYDSNRKRFRDYNFEQQGSILEDAYRVLVEGVNPEHNTAMRHFDMNNSAHYYEAFALYRMLVDQFQNYHKELVQRYAAD